MIKLSEDGQRLMEALKAARDESDGVPALEWRELETFGKKLRSSLCRFTMIESRMKADGLHEYRITPYGLDALEKFLAHQANPPKRGRKTGEPKPSVFAGREAKLPPKTTFAVREQIKPFSPNAEQKLADHSVREQSPEPSRDYSPAPQARPLPEITVSQGVATEQPQILVALAPAPDPQSSNELKHSDGCTGCVYEQAVEILAKRFVGVNELVDALKLIGGQ